MCQKPRNLDGLGAQWARNLAIYEVWAASGPNAQNMLSETHSGHIWSNAGKMLKTSETHSGHIWAKIAKMLKIGLLRLILVISGPRLPKYSNMPSEANLPISPCISL